MPGLLFALSGLVGFGGVARLALAKGDIHEIEALMLFTIAAVLLAGAVVAKEIRDIAAK